MVWPYAARAEEDRWASFSNGWGPGGYQSSKAGQDKKGAKPSRQEGVSYKKISGHGEKGTE